MEQTEIKRIKKIVVSGIFADGFLREKFVMKGGNVLDLLYDMAPRASMDIDFSLEEKLGEVERAEVAQKLESVLRDSFAEEHYYLFDFKFEPRPKEPKADQPPWWGGYKISFKIISKDRFDAIGGEIEKLRREATVVNPGQKRTFSIDISECEWVEGKEKRLLDGVVVLAYSPSMLLCEKSRALCQQMEEYKEYVPNPTRSARARDFFDIFVLCHAFNLNIESVEFGNQLRRIFKAKNVPLALMENIDSYRDFHSSDFQSVIDTLKPGEEILEYDEYFDFVCDLFSKLETLWVE